jgi:type IV secretion system protein TrbL
VELAAPVAVPESASCPSCGAPAALDQHYCLHCGERIVQARSRFLGGLAGRDQPPAGAVGGSPGAPIAQPPGRAPLPPAVTWLAGIGVLLLAMGVGVLIGRSGGGKALTVPPQVVTVDAGGSAAAGGVASTPASAPTTPAGTSAGEVTAGKKAAVKKGAKAGGAAGGGSSSGTAGSGKSGTHASSPKSSGESGQSYEQKLRNQPDVVETG